MKFKISGSTLKIIAMISMLIDHIGAGLLDRILIDNGYSAVSLFNIGAISNFNNFKLLGYVILIFRIVGRLAFPIYCFLLVEGFKYTKNIKKYIIRLFIFALISEIPFDLAFCGKIISFEQQNVFFSLSLGMTLLWIYELINKNKYSKKILTFLSILAIFFMGGIILYLLAGAKWADKTVLEMGFNCMLLIYTIATIISFILYLILAKIKTFNKVIVFYSKILFLILTMFAAIIIKCDYSFGILLAVTIMYKFKDKKIKSYIYSLICLSILDPCELLSIPSIILIMLYNGKKGLNLKYIFYIFYPLHLLIISFICFIFHIL